MNAAWNAADLLWLAGCFGITAEGLTLAAPDMRVHTVAEQKREAGVRRVPGTV